MATSDTGGSWVILAGAMNFAILALVCWESWMIFQGEGHILLATDHARALAREAGAEVLGSELFEPFVNLNLFYGLLLALSSVLCLHTYLRGLARPDEPLSPLARLRNFGGLALVSGLGGAFLLSPLFDLGTANAFHPLVAKPALGLGALVSGGIFSTAVYYAVFRKRAEARAANYIPRKREFFGISFR